jgi:pimeloyl-ACP methyl ester carboxylesterase/DNA-binding winged helix-turn-helix (wHTH) protein
MRCRFGNAELDLARRELRVDGVSRPLQPRVLDVLGYLVRHRERVVPKEELLRELWPDAVVTDASLQRAVSLARRALGPSGSALLRTHARRGYRFAGAVEELERGAPERVAGGPPRYVRRGDLHVAYRTGGEGPVDLVMVLGWSLSMRSALELEGVAALIRALSARARVLLLDKRGTGASDRVKALPTLAERVQDVEAVLDAVRSPGAILAGFSEGGPLAITLAAARPARIRGLALVGAFARMASAPDHPHGWSAAEVEALRTYLRRAWGSGATLRAIIPARHLTPALRDWAARAEQEGASPGAALDLLEMNLALDVRPLLPAIRVPTVVLHATRDPVVRVGNGRALADAIPHARLVEVDGDDHAFLFRERGRLARELGALVERVRSTPARRDLIDR